MSHKEQNHPHRFGWTNPLKKEFRGVVMWTQDLWVCAYLSSWKCSWKLQKNSVFTFNQIKNMLDCFAAKNPLDQVWGFRVLPHWLTLSTVSVARHWLKPLQLSCGVQFLVLVSLLSNPASSVPISASSQDEGKLEGFLSPLQPQRIRKQNDSWIWNPVNVAGGCRNKKKKSSCSLILKSFLRAVDLRWCVHVCLYMCVVTFLSPPEAHPPCDATELILRPSQLLLVVAAAFQDSLVYSEL